MSDIVERLRSTNWSGFDGVSLKASRTIEEAADEIERLRSELEQCQQAAFRALEWQPIETAPHETDVILYAPANGHFPAKIETGWASGGKRVTLSDGSIASNMWNHGYATHWLALPPPPKEDGK